MATQEIERKFLVVGTAWQSLAQGVVYRQGYLSTVKERTVRVRTIGSQGFLTIKGVSVGASRLEYEYEIPHADAEELLDNLCERPLIEKSRYKIPFQNLIWEVDLFAGVNQGLVIAEVELQEEGQRFGKPDWVGEEVTHDARYFNANLIAKPFSVW